MIKWPQPWQSLLKQNLLCLCWSRVGPNWAGSAPPATALIHNYYQSICYPGSRHHTGVLLTAAISQWQTLKTKIKQHWMHQYSWLRVNVMGYIAVYKHIPKFEKFKTPLQLIYYTNFIASHQLTQNITNN